MSLNILHTWCGGGTRLGVSLLPGVVVVQGQGVIPPCLPHIVSGTHSPGSVINHHIMSTLLTETHTDKTDFVSFKFMFELFIYNFT